MSGLLDLALGFGFGSAGGYVEQKKADIQAQREANLARLRAKYGTEQAKELAEFESDLETEQLEEQYDRLGITPEERRRLEREALLGETERDSKFQNYKDPETGRVLVLDENDPQARQKIEQLGLVRAGSASADPEDDDPEQYTGRLLDFKVEDGTVRLPQDHPDAQEFINRGVPFSEARTDEYTHPVSGREFVHDPVTGSREVTSEGTVSLGQRTRAAGEGVGGEGSTEAAVMNMPPADYLAKGTGPLSRLRGTLFRTPFLGEIMDGGSAANERAKQDQAFLERKITRAYRYNDSRTTNMDIQEAKKLMPKLQAFSTDEAAYESVQELQRQIEMDMRDNLSIMNDRNMPPDDRQAASSFVRELRGVMERLDGYMAGALVHNTKIKGNRGSKTVSKLNPDEYMNVMERIRNNDYTPSPREASALRLWGEFLNNRGGAYAQ